MNLPRMDWTWLMLAGAIEIAWVIGLKYTDGFTRPWPTVLTLAGMVASVFFLTLATRTIPLGTAYAIWTGIGAVGTVVLAIILFGESASPARLIFIAIILLGILGLKAASI